VKGLAIAHAGSDDADLNRSGIDDATGILVPPGDAKEVAHGLECLVDDALLRRHLSGNASRDARLRFDLNRQVEAYLDWYRAILQRSKNGSPNRGCQARVEGR
jgi:glycosyltransferase involved in cell wall biosynthesis